MKSIYPFDSRNTYRAYIYSIDEILAMEETPWITLSENSLYANPFFEPWHLKPALQSFAKKGQVYVIVIKKQDDLVGLCPVEIKRRWGLFPYLTIWQHDHCCSPNPLLKQNIPLTDLFANAARQLGCLWSLIKDHNPKLNMHGRSSFVTQAKTSRAAIFDSSQLQDHLKSLKGKFHRENRRLLRNAKRDLDIRFFEYTQVRQGLLDFIALEKLGWKGKDGGAIACQQSTLGFYQALIEDRRAHNFLQVFALKSGNINLACAVRIQTGSHLYEIKTTFHEGYRRYAPGRVLECYLLEKLSERRGLFVDSCTHHNNQLINTLWPDQLAMTNTHIFSQSWLGLISKSAHFVLLRLKRTIRQA